MYESDSYEQPLTAGFEFSEKSIRLGFIRKVYGILMCQLLVTLAIVCLLVFEPNSKLYAQTHPAMMYTAMGMTIVCIITLACCNDVRRRTPTNFIVLAIFTFCEAFLVGTVSSFYDAKEVSMALGICAIVSFGLTLFAFQTKYDFTMLNGFLFVSLIVLFCFGLVAVIVQNNIVNLIYASLGALLFCVYLVFDTQLMLGGNHKYSISPEEYVFAALNLYLDIINLFLYILTIIGSARK